MQHRHLPSNQYIRPLQLIGYKCILVLGPIYFQQIAYCTFKSSLRKCRGAFVRYLGLNGGFTFMIFYIGFPLNVRQYYYIASCYITLTNKSHPQGSEILLVGKEKHKSSY